MTAHIHVTLADKRKMTLADKRKKTQTYNGRLECCQRMAAIRELQSSSQWEPQLLRLGFLLAEQPALTPEEAT